MGLSPTSIAIISLISTYIFILCFSEHWVRSASGYVIGNRRRIVAVLKMQVMMTLLNMFVYRQLMHFFEEDEGYPNKEFRRQMAKMRARCSVFLISVLFLAQLMYAMYYCPEWIQWLLFDLTTLCSGIWTNLLAFVCGFYLVNVLRKPFLNFPPTRWLIDCVSQVGYLHSLIFDRKSQIRFTVCVSLILSFAMWIGCDYIVIKERTIPIRNLSSDGPLRFAMISDIHAGASVYRHQVDLVVDQVLSMDVDAVLIVGDMVDGPMDLLRERVEPIWQLAHRFPTYFVTGNHDYYYGDVMEWIRLYQQHGVHVLQNTHELFRGICLGGVNDISSGKTGVSGHYLNASSAFAGCPPSTTRLLLSHNPAAVKDIPIEDLQTIDLVLSGHTHAGQFYVVIPMVYWMLPYFYGMYDLPHGKLMVSAGTLYQGPNMKMLGMSEIWKLTLVPA